MPVDRNDHDHFYDHVRGHCLMNFVLLAFEAYLEYRLKMAALSACPFVAPPVWLVWFLGLPPTNACPTRPLFTFYHCRQHLPLEEVFFFLLFFQDNFTMRKSPPFVPGSATKSHGWLRS